MKEKNSFRHIDSLTKADGFHPITATGKTSKFILSLQSVGVAFKFVWDKSEYLYFCSHIYIVIL